MNLIRYKSCSEDLRFCLENHKSVTPANDENKPGEPTVEPRSPSDMTNSSPKSDKLLLGGTALATVIFGRAAGRGGMVVRRKELTACRILRGRVV